MSGTFSKNSPPNVQVCQGPFQKFSPLLLHIGPQSQRLDVRAHKLTGLYLTLTLLFAAQ